MRNLREYGLYLLDLDGLLVNTEELHYEAYLQMCAARGYHLLLTFAAYCDIAHHSAEGMEQYIYTQFPRLQAQEPRWSILYAEKKAAYTKLLHTRPMDLMPGVDRLLYALKEAQVKRCVVTHSAADLAKTIRAAHPALQTIPYWMTRESYQTPKPSPECYQRAIAVFAEPNEAVIGLEDSPRGLNALLGTRAQPVLIASPEVACCLNERSWQFPSIDAFLDAMESRS